MTPNDLTAEDERDCSRVLEQLEAQLLVTLTRCTPADEGPRFTSALEISALLRLASRKILEADPDDRSRYVAMVHEVARQVAPWSADGGRAH